MTWLSMSLWEIVPHLTIGMGDWSPLPLWWWEIEPSSYTMWRLCPTYWHFGIMCGVGVPHIIILAQGEYSLVYVWRLCPIHPCGVGDWSLLIILSGDCFPLGYFGLACGLCIPHGEEYVSVSCDMLIFFWIHEFTLVYICLWIVEIDPTMIIYVWRLVPS